jgi:hypothetical protein
LFKIKLTQFVVLAETRRRRNARERKKKKRWHFRASGEAVYSIRSSRQYALTITSSAVIRKIFAGRERLEEKSCVGDPKRATLEKIPFKVWSCLGVDRNPNEM